MKARLLYILFFCCAIFIAHQCKSDSIKAHPTESRLLKQKYPDSLNIQQPRIPDENILYADDDNNTDDSFGTQKAKSSCQTKFSTIPGPNCPATTQCGTLSHFHEILKINQPIYILLHQLLIHFTV